jgi:hypothetical protein
VASETLRCTAGRRCKTLRASKERFIGVVDGLASIVALGITLIAIVGMLLRTPQRWEAAFLLLSSPPSICLADIRSTLL